jgi:acyl carrier protein
VTSEAAESKLVAFLETILRPDVPVEALHESDDLVRAGLIDSLAVLEIVSFLESEFGVDFAATGIDPEKLSSIPNILELIG